MTCNTQYGKDERKATDVVIGNFYGDSFKVSDNENDSTWDSMGDSDALKVNWFQKDDQV